MIYFTFLKIFSIAPLFQFFAVGALYTTRKCEQLYQQKPTSESEKKDKDKDKKEKE